MALADAKKARVLSSITALKKLCNHPKVCACVNVHVHV